MEKLIASLVNGLILCSDLSGNKNIVILVCTKFDGVTVFQNF